MEHTPIERVFIDNQVVFVKREDLYSWQPDGSEWPCNNELAPPFAKPRGLVPHLKWQKRIKPCLTHVAYMDTSISMAGVALSYYAPMLGLKPIIFFPGIKQLGETALKHYQQCQELGADVRLLENPTQMSINWYRAREILQKEFGIKALLLPQGLPFKETVLSVAREADTIPPRLLGGTVVMCLGSGVMAAGVLTSLITKARAGIAPPTKLVGVPVSGQAPWKIREKIFQRINLPFLRSCYGMIHITSCKWDYLEEAQVSCPFPCNTFYDLKAWKYLVENIHLMERPILFWNIGA